MNRNAYIGRNVEILFKNSIEDNPSEMFLNIAHPVSVEEKPWPQEGDEFWLVDLWGDPEQAVYSSMNKYYVSFRKRGNFFQTKEAAEMYSLRIESLSKGVMPSKNQNYWVWDFYDEHAQEWVKTEYLEKHVMTPKFPTKEECQEWYDQFGKSWEYLLNKQK